MEKSLSSTESAKSLSTLKPPRLHFLHANNVSYIFKLGSQTTQHEKPNNTIILQHKIWIKNSTQGGLLIIFYSHQNNALKHTTSCQFFSTMQHIRLWNSPQIISEIFIHNYDKNIAKICEKLPQFYSFSMPS